MSLTVLKRKSQTKYSKLSSGPLLFSLNNPRRIYSKSGRGRVQSQTPMKGNVYRGHGTKGARTYGDKIIKSQYVNDDPFVIDNSNGGNTSISVKGRHDPCVGIRAVPIGEAMLSCVLLDHFLMNRAQCG